MENIKSYYGSLEFGTNLLDTIFKFYPDGIVYKNCELKYQYINDGYCKIFSIENAQDLLSESKNKFLSAQNIQLIYDADRVVIQSLYPLNYVINTDQNSIINITTCPIVKDSKFTGLISFVKDITQEENLKTDFVNKHFEYIDNQKNLQTQRETFVASISHDLKNPTLAQIRGLELMLKGAFGNLNKEQSEILTMILDSCRYMNGMLSSLLATYRNYGGVVKLNFSEFLLESLVNECVSEMIYVAKDKSLEIKTIIADESQVCADRVQIKRVIMNLISNAIKYAYKNTDLKLSVYKDSKNIHFEFENKSPYIPIEKQKTIFARYVSYAGMHKELGVGLGLYASKKIIESHCGKIYLKSFKDERNIFGFQIPVEQKNGCAKEILL